MKVKLNKIEYFRYLVKLKGYKAKEFATLLGYSDRQYQYLLKHQAWKLKDIKKIIELLEMKFEEIFIDD